MAVTTQIPVSAEQRERLADVWNHMLAHAFLLETRDGISDETFACCGPGLPGDTWPGVPESGC
jgi:hypothetical protein